MAKKKLVIKTALRGSFGQEISTAKGKVKFDEEGEANVSKDMAEYLQENFGDVYYLKGENKPNPKSKKLKTAKDADLKDFTRAHTAQKDAERKGAAPKVEKSTSVEAGDKKDLVDEKGDPIKKGEGDSEDSADLTTTDEFKENHKMLDNLSIPKIKDAMQENGLWKDEFSNLSPKEELVNACALEITKASMDTEEESEEESEEE